MPMRKELEVIENIEKYLEGGLSESEKMQFEASLSSDAVLQNEVQIQKEINGGIERQILKAEIATAYKQYNKTRKLQQYSIYAIILLAIGTAGLLYNMKPDNTEIAVKTQNEIIPAPVNTDPETGPVSDATQDKVIALPKQKQSIAVRHDKAVVPPSSVPEKSADTFTENKDEVIEAAAPLEVVKEADAPAIAKTENKPAVAINIESPVLPSETSREAVSVPEVSKTETQVYVPNAFSPNGDGVNDVFKIPADGLADVKCTIFSLEGEKVYEWSGTDGSWDGKTGTERSVKNIFTYSLRVKHIGSQNFSPAQSGTVTIVK